MPLLTGILGYLIEAIPFAPILRDATQISFLPKMLMPVLPVCGIIHNFEVLSNLERLHVNPTESMNSRILNVSPYDNVASAPLAFTTPFVPLSAGIAIGCPRCLAVKFTISWSINSRVSLVRSSTSEGWRFFVSIGFKTVH